MPQSPAWNFGSLLTPDHTPSTPRVPTVPAAPKAPSWDFGRLLDDDDEAKPFGLLPGEPPLLERRGNQVVTAEAAPPRTQPVRGLMGPSAIGPASRSLSQAIKEEGTDLLNSITKGVMIGIPEAVLGWADILSKGKAGKTLDDLDLSPDQIRDEFDRLYPPSTRRDLVAEQFAKAPTAVDKAIVALSNPSMIANAVAESLPSMVVGGAVGRGVRAVAGAGRIGPTTAGAIGEGVLGAGQSAESIRQQSGTRELTGWQATAAAASGALTSLFGKLGGSVAAKLGLDDVDTLLAGAAASPAARKNLVSAVLGSAFSEGVLEELGQSVSEQVLQNVATGRPISEGVSDSAVLGTLAGMAMGGTASGARQAAVRLSAPNVTETPTGDYDFGDLLKTSETDTDTGPVKYASTQFNLPKDVADRVLTFGRELVPDSALVEDGRETAPHLTLRFGLRADEDVDRVREVLANQPPVTVTLGPTSIFPASESGSGDVVKIDVDSPALRGLRSRIEQEIDAPGETHPDYTPHITLGYVPTGQGAQFAGRDDLAGETVTLDTLTFSRPDGTTVDIQLTGTETRVDRPWRVNAKGNLDLYFPQPPSTETAQTLRDAGWDLNQKQKIWYAPDTAENRALAEQLDRVETARNTPAKQPITPIGPEPAVTIPPAGQMLPQAAMGSTLGAARGPVQETLGVPGVRQGPSGPVAQRVAPIAPGGGPGISVPSGAPARWTETLPAQHREHFQSLLDDARQSGYTGPDDSLADRFQAAVTEAQQIARDLTDTEVAQETSDLLKSIARMGGIGIEAESAAGMRGELEHMLEGLARVGRVRRGARSGQAMPRQFLRSGGLPGIPGIIVRKGGLTLDAIREGINEDPRWAGRFESLPDFVAAVDEAIGIENGTRQPTAAATYSIPSILSGALGIEPGSGWWREADAPTSETAETGADQDISFDPAELERPAAEVAAASGVPPAQGVAPAVLEQTAAPTSPAFRQWFGDSKAVDGSGRPLVLYHGTSDDVAAFNLDHPNRKDSGWLGRGVYLSQAPEIASDYSTLKRGGGNPNVMPMFARLRNPYYATLADKQRFHTISIRDGAPAARVAAEEWTNRLKAQGYDGVILRYTADQVGADHARQTEFVVFDPAGVKSATGNQGTFSSSDPNILRQEVETQREKVQALKDRNAPEPVVAHAEQKLQDLEQQVDMLSTGEAQPRLPEAGAVRDLEITPEQLAQVPSGSYTLGNLKAAMNLTDDQATALDAYVQAMGLDTSKIRFEFRQQTGLGLAQSAQTTSDAFKKWFSKSKVVDETGQALVVYHGTHLSFDEFRHEHGGRIVPQRNAMETFSFTDSPSVAEWYANQAARIHERRRTGVAAIESYAPGVFRDVSRGPAREEMMARAEMLGEGRQQIVPVYLSIQNPLRVSMTRRSRVSVDEWTRRAQAQGKDGLIIQMPSVEERGLPGGTYYLVFNPTQIKSAIANRGTFDPSNPNILRQDEPDLADQIQQQITDLQREIETNRALLDDPDTSASDREMLSRHNREKTAMLSEAQRDLGALLRSRLKKQIEAMRSAAPRILQQTNAPDVRNWYYSNIVKALTTWQNKGTSAQLLAHLQKFKGAMEEADTIGFSAWLQGREKVTREEAQRYLDEHQIEVREVQKPEALSIDLDKTANELYGRDYDQIDQDDQLHVRNVANEHSRMAKYAQYQTPGATNYREVLLTLPERRTYDETPSLDKWLPEQPWYETWRSNGSNREQAIELFNEWLKRENYGRPDNYRSPHRDEPNVLAHLRVNDRTIDGRKTLFIEAVPNQPFKGNAWKKLVLKRALALAAEGGYDALAWTSGSQQKDRYFGHELIRPAVQRWNEIAKPESVREEELQDIRREFPDRVELEYVNAAMLAARENEQVLRAVVQAIPVDVMDILSANSVDAYEIVRNFDVQRDRLPVVARAPVARGIGKASMLVGARLRAALNRVLAPESARRDEELLPAVSAGDLNPRVVMRLLAPLGETDLGVKIGSFADKDPSAGDRTKPSMSPSSADLAGETPKLSTAQLAEALNRHAEIVARGTGNEVEYVQPPPGKWAENLYDKELPNLANELGKKYGAKATTASIPQVTEEGTHKKLSDRQDVHFMAIPEAMRTDIKDKGLPLFQKMFDKPGVKGEVEFLPDGVAVIRGFAAADFSTAVHEVLGHVARRQLVDLGVPAEMRAGVTDQDIRTVAKWAGAKATKDGGFDWDVDAEENFARGMERVLFEGNAPYAKGEGPRFLPPAVRRVLVKVRDWLKAIYVNFATSPINVEISPEARQVFDRLLTRTERVQIAQSQHQPKIMRVTTSAGPEAVRPPPVRRAPKQAGLGFEGDQARLFQRGSQKPELFNTAPPEGAEAPAQRGAQKEELFETPRETVTPKQGSLNIPPAGKPPTAPPPNGPAWKARVDDLLTRFKENVVNDWQRVKDLEREPGLRKSGDLTPYERRKLMPGRLGQQVEAVEDRVQALDRDLVDTAKRLGIPEQDLQADVYGYLIARHAPERNAAIGERAAGMSDQEAAARIQDISAKPHVAEIQRLADDLQTFHNETLDLLHADGRAEAVVDRDLYTKLRETYPHHMPLQRVFENEDVGAQMMGERGLNVLSTGLKRATGSERAIRDLAENIYTARLDAIKRVEKNIVDNETFRLAKDYITSFPGQDLFEIVEPKAIGTDWQGKILREQMTDPHILAFRHQGKPAYIKVNDDRLALALRGVNREELPGWLRTIGGVTRFLSGMYTRYAPEFPLPNKIRDLQEVMVVLAADGRLKSRGAKQLLAKDPASVSAIMDYVRGKDTDATKLYRQFLSDGATTGGMALSTRKDVAKSLEAIRKLNRQPARQAIKRVVSTVDGINRLFEDSTRFTVYRLGLENGLSREKAAVLAKTASIDFNEFGRLGPTANSLYMFANASIQGNANMFRAMRDPKVAAAVIASVGVAVAAATQWNDLWDEDWRQKVSEWDRASSLNLVIPGTDEFRYITIPVSWGIRPIKRVFEYTSDLLSGAPVSVGEASAGTLASLIEAYNPVGGTDVASAITPTVARTPLELTRNVNWSGGKIRPDKDPFAPNSVRYFSDLSRSATGRAFIAATRAASESTGGRIEISPADLQYGLSQMTGGPGAFASKVINTVKSIGKGEAPEMRDVPWMSRFVREVPMDRFRQPKSAIDIDTILMEQSRRRFYEREEAETLYQELVKMPPDQLRATVRELATTKPEVVRRLDQIDKDAAKGLTREDRRILQLGVENGERAKYLYEVWKTIPPAGQTEWIQTAQRKGLISPAVARQMDLLERTKDRAR